MIQNAFITAWRDRAPWALDEQVEQDLVLSRAIVEIFADPLLSSSFAFRGGTALHKLYLSTPARYSEDIDLVQIEAGPIGPAMNAMRGRISPWLGKPKWKQGHGRVTFVFRFSSETPPVIALRLKVEINTREHFKVLDLRRQEFAVDNGWYSGKSEVLTYAPEELLATKLRALYQRRKGRDLFDLGVAFDQLPDLDPDKVIDCFRKYMDRDGLSVSRAEFEANLAQKLDDKAFGEDVDSLLALGMDGRPQLFEPAHVSAQLGKLLIERLPGAPWKGND